MMQENQREPSSGPRDARPQAEPAPESSRPASGKARPQLPEPSLKTFISGLAGQVLINLGLLENPVTGKRAVELEQAKYSIDLLQILKDKMKGNLTDEEEKLINTILYDLRMRYVEACR